LSSYDTIIRTRTARRSSGPAESVRHRPATHTAVYDHLNPLLIEYADGRHGKARRDALRRELVEGFRPVAQNIARRYSGRGEPVDDLEQVAAIGLIKAIDRFEPGRGVTFLSYAVPTMMGEVRRHFRDATWSVHTPRGVKDRHQQVAAAANTLSHEVGRAPTATELAHHLDLDRELVIEAMAAERCRNPSSLDETLGAAPDGDTAVGDLIARADDLEASDVGVLLGDVVRTLSRRERTILVLRFVDDCTQREIADLIGVSQMQVSRLLAQCLERLRQRLHSRGIDTATGS
jgi:RNA polymerase sigma-B factor